MLVGNTAAVTAFAGIVVVPSSAAAAAAVAVAVESLPIVVADSSVPLPPLPTTPDCSTTLSDPPASPEHC